MEKKTILYAGNFELPDKGAAANRVVSNAKLFASIGYQVVVLGVSDDVFADEFRNVVNDSGLCMLERKSPKTTVDWIKYMYSTRIFSDAIKKYKVNIVILYNLPYAIVARLRKICKRNDIKLAYDCTEWTSFTFKEEGMVKNIVKKRNMGLIKNKLESKVDGTIVISRALKQHYQKNVLLLPPLVDISDKIWSIRRDSGDRETKWFEFCFSGTIDGEKDKLDMVVYAFLKLKKKNVRLRIIGVTEEEFVGIFGDIPAKSERNEIVFMGKLPHEVTIKYVYNCDAFVFARESTIRNNVGFPTKFVEAFTCGVPIITTNISDVGLYMNDDASGIVIDDLKIDGITTAMEQVLDARLFEKNRKLRDTFDYRKYSVAADKWIRDLLSEGHNGEK